MIGTQAHAQHFILTQVYMFRTRGSVYKPETHFPSKRMIATYILIKWRHFVWGIFPRIMRVWCYVCKISKVVETSRARVNIQNHFVVNGESDLRRE